MLGSTVREFARATPFAPFVIQMNDGRRLTIAHPDCVSVSPKGSKVIAYDAHEDETRLSGLLGASVRPLKSKARRNGRSS